MVKKKHFEGSGRGGRSEETWGRDQEHGQEISLGNQSQRYAEDQDFQQRRAGQRFHYRRKARWRKPFTCGWEDCGSSYLLLVWISLFLVTLPTLSYTAALANGFAICLPPWTASIESPCYVFTPSQVPSDSAPHCGVLAAAPATSGAMCANATSFIHFRMAPDQVGLRVHWTSALAKFFTLPYSIQHLQTLPTIHAHRRPRLLVTAPPITCSRSPARPDRTVSSRLPAHLRPAVPPACRPNCPGRPARTRPPLSRSAQRLHASKPCHSVPDGTPCTLQKYREKNSEKKSPIHRSNNVLQEPGGGIRAQHTRHQLGSRANPAYVFLVPLPLASHNHRPLRAGTRTASSRPLTLAHTLPHGRLQRTDGPSSMDHDLRGRPPASPSPLFTQTAAASPATPTLQPTWGSPATLPATPTGAWLGTRVQRTHDRHGPPSTPAVQFMDTPVSAVSQTPELGSGVGDACRTETHGLQLVPLQHQGRRAAHIMPSDGTSPPVVQLRHSSAPLPLRVHLPLPPNHSSDTWASALNHTPELGSGVKDIGPSPRTAAPLQQFADTPDLSTTQTPELGSGMRDEDAETRNPGPTLPAVDCTCEMRRGFHLGKAPDSRARLGSAESLLGHARLDFASITEGICRRNTSKNPSVQPQSPNELAAARDGYPHLNSAPDSRARLRSGGHLSWQSPYLSASVGPERSAPKPPLESNILPARHIASLDDAPFLSNLALADEQSMAPIPTDLHA